MLPESLAPSLREQLSRARAWWLKDQAEGRSGVALPDALEREVSARRAFLAVVLVFAQHTHSTDPRSGVVRRHHMYDQTFQRAFKRRRTSRHHEARHTAHPPPLVRDGLAPQRLRHSNRAGSARPFRDVSTTMIYTHVLKVGGAASNGRLRKVLPASADGRQQPVVA